MKHFGFPPCEGCGNRFPGNVETLRITWDDKRLIKQKSHQVQFCLRDFTSSKLKNSCPYPKKKKFLQVGLDLGHSVIVQLLSVNWARC